MLTAMHMGLSEIYESLSDGVGQGIEEFVLARMTAVAGVDEMWAAAGEFEGEFTWVMKDGVGGDYYQGGQYYS